MYNHYYIAGPSPNYASYNYSILQYNSDYITYYRDTYTYYTTHISSGGTWDDWMS